MTQQNTNTNRNLNSNDDEIDLIALTKTLWKGRKTVIRTTLKFVGIGLFVAIFSSKEYTASTTFVSQNKEVKVGRSIGGLAAMAGINLGSMGGDSGISPELYPHIINSIPFQLELLQTPLTIEGKKEQLSYADYYANEYNPGLFGYLKKYTIDLPNALLSLIKGKQTSDDLAGEEGPQILSITKEENELIEQLSDQLVLEVNEDGYISISTSMPEALSSAQMAYRAVELLQQYIIDFKIQKSRDQLKFIEKRYFEKEVAFKTLQEQLARFRDRNQNTNSALAQTSLERLESEYDLAYGLYFELAKQLETQQIQVKEDTPMFTILKPVSIPSEKSKPKRVIILIMWTFLGGIIGSVMVIGSGFLKKLKEDWNER